MALKHFLNFLPQRLFSDCCNLRFHPCPFVGLSAGLHNNVWTDFSETWIESGSQPRIDPINLLVRFWIKGQFQEHFLTFNIARMGVFWQLKQNVKK